MKRTKSYLLLSFIAFALVITLSPVFGTGQKEAAKSRSSATASTAPVKVTMFAQFARDVVNPNTNWFTKYAEKRFNLNIHWTLVPPSGNIQAKQALLLASGNYPDVFWDGQFTPWNVLKYAQQQVIKPIDKNLVKEYAPNVWKAMQSNQAIRDISIGPDGQMWGLPDNQNYCVHCYFGSEYWINTKLLQKYGQKMPTTTSQFESVLEVFKQHHLIPLSGTVAGPGGGWHGNVITFLMNSFVYNTDNQNATDFLDVSHGKVSFAATAAQWKQGLAYMHQLYRKGLIDQEAFSQHLGGLEQEIAQGKVAVVASGASNILLSGGSDNPNYKYWRTIPPLVGPNGVHYAAFYGNGDPMLGFVLTSKATRRQEVALLKLINFLYTPLGTEMWDFGPKGKYWSSVKSGQLDAAGKQALFNTNLTKFYSGNSLQNYGYDQTGPGYQSAVWRRGHTLGVAPFSPGSDSATNFYMSEKSMVGHQPTEVYPASAWVPSSGAQQFALYNTNLYDYVMEWTTQFITGTKSITNDWGRYVAGVRNIGLSSYLSIAQKAMKEPYNTSEFSHPDYSAIKYLTSLMK